MNKELLSTIGRMIGVANLATAALDAERVLEGLWTRPQGDDLAATLRDLIFLRRIESATTGRDDDPAEVLALDVARRGLNKLGPEGFHKELSRRIDWSLRQLAGRQDEMESAMADAASEDALTAARRILPALEEAGRLAVRQAAFIAGWKTFKTALQDRLAELVEQRGGEPVLAVAIAEAYSLTDGAADGQDRLADELTATERQIASLGPTEEGKARADLDARRAELESRIEAATAEGHRLRRERANHCAHEFAAGSMNAIGEVLRLRRAVPVAFGPGLAEAVGSALLAGLEAAGGRFCGLAIGIEPGAEPREETLAGSLWRAKWLLDLNLEGAAAASPPREVPHGVCASAATGVATLGMSGAYAP
jgi:hypothetical protein